MKKGSEIIGWMIAACLLMSVSCTNRDEGLYQVDGPVTADFACAFSQGSSQPTRQVSEVVQPNNSQTVRLPQSLRVIPTITGVPNLGTFTWETPVEKGRSFFYYTSICTVSKGVNGCLVYGKPADVSDTQGINAKVYNGSLIESFPAAFNTQEALNQISFSLEPIYSSQDIPEEAQTLANYMTSVANLDDWKNNLGNKVLKDLFNSFTNNGNVIPGSAASVKRILLTLASSAQQYIDNPPSLVNSTEMKNVLTVIKNKAIMKANNTNPENDPGIGEITATSYPRNKHLPDAAAVLRWVESSPGVGAFQPQLNTTTLDDINSVARFTYPASLYYFVESDIRTSNTLLDYQSLYENAYQMGDKTAWENVLDHFTSGSTVTADTKSILLKTPVQYGVAHLKVNIQANAQYMKDSQNKDIEIGTDHFKLTGIIVCGQRPVDYTFKQTSNSDENVRFIYDSQVESNCFLKSGGYILACNTLVLQSYDNGTVGDDVNIILEFENVTSNLTFRGADGFVYPGTRFYMIGKVESKKTDIDEDVEKRVFTKDYITTVNMNVTSLAKAYNVVPNLLTNYFEVGVETTPDWVAATPTVIRFE